MDDEEVFGLSSGEGEENEVGDNMAAAMSKVVDSMSLTRKPKTNAPDGETASRQVILRATERDHDRWKQAAAAQNISMSEFIRNVCNTSADQLLDCSHPVEFRKTYPWSDQCFKCGMRLK
jgi:predicted HicB family RNase H-like nuclease